MNLRCGWSHGPGHFPILGPYKVQSHLARFSASACCIGWVSRMPIPATRPAPCGGICVQAVTAGAYPRPVGGASLVDMAMLVLFLGMLVAASVAALFELTPDTHRECSQHGDFEF